MFTHLHQDHCRGATWSGELTFPRATGFAHAAEVAFWSGAQAAGITADEHLGAAREAIRLFGDRLRPFGHDTEILPGVRIVDAAGHTPGHSAVLLQSDGQRLLCVGDLFHDPLQLSHPRWCTPWDHDTVRAVRARRRLLDRAADQQLLIHAYHMPSPAWARSPGMATPTGGNRYGTMNPSTPRPSAPEAPMRQVRIGVQIRPRWKANPKGQRLARLARPEA